MSSKKGKRKMVEEKNEVEEIEKVGKIAESEDEALGDLDLDRWPLKYTALMRAKMLRMQKGFW